MCIFIIICIKKLQRQTRHGYRVGELEWVEGQGRIQIVLSKPFKYNYDF